MCKNIIKSVLVTAILICMLAVLSNFAFAVPALEVQQDTVQPSGEVFKSTLHGDEWLNWRSTDTDDVLVKDENGYWCYAQIESGKLKATDKKYKIHQKPENAATNKDVAKLKKNNPHVSVNPPPALAAGTPWNEKMLVLLVNFSNIGIANSDSYWSNVMYGTSGSTVKNYYNEVSGGLFSFAPAAETAGTANDGIIRVTLNYNHPNTGANTDSRNQQITSDALNAANPYINYASFDTNGDGTVSANELHVVVITAGYETSCGGSQPAVWGHSWSTWINLDGKYLGPYTMQGEYHEDHPATIGILCHELGHSLGLPDLYDTDYSSDGIGTHSLMAGGSWGSAGGYMGSSPVHLDAWCKIRLGYYTPTVASVGTYPVKSFDAGYSVVKIPTSKSNEYFLLENRRFVGYDAALQNGGVGGQGIAIWHIDESMSGNTNEAHKLVDLEEANQGSLGYSQLDTKQGGTKNHYYYAGSFTTFDNNTNPNSKFYDGSSSNISVNANVGSSNTMNVTLGGGYGLSNVALNKTATANQYLTNEEPQKGVDGSTTTKWCSNAAGDKWLKIDLGQSYDITRWVVRHAGAGGESAGWNTYNFKLQKSSDGNTWTDVDTVTGNTANVTDRTVALFNTRYVRLYVTQAEQSGNGAARIYEFEVYGTAGGGIAATPYFMIVNRNSGKCLDLIGGDTSNGARINQWAYDYNSANQRFAVLPTGDGHFKIISYVSGKSMSVVYGSMENEAQIHDWDYLGNPDQKWDFIDAGNGWYKIRNVNSGKMLDVAWASLDNDAKVQQNADNGNPAEQWRLQPWGDYNIKTTYGRYVCVENMGSTNGSRIIQYDYENNPWFKWRFENVGDGWYKVSSLNAITRCIDVKDVSTAPAAITHLWDYVGGDNQKVSILPKTNGTFQFFFKHDGMSWDIPSGQTGNNVPLEQYPNNGGANQEFTLERVP